MGLSEALNFAPGAVVGNFYCCSNKLNLSQELLKPPSLAKIPFLRLTQNELCHLSQKDGEQSGNRKQDEIWKCSG